ncbi:MAG: DNA-formamidopyrimidine glycosylase [Deltaproteobacteria bacterium]|nr:DNA-formamidopyrimidine glycosylase [Deltaproteobacteria bacterium]
MPELPEVETIVRELRSIIPGRRVERVGVKLNKIIKTGPRRLSRLLNGAEALDVQRLGKFLIFEFDAERYLVVHLRMTGQFAWHGERGGWPKYVHVKIQFEDGAELLYRDVRQFGRFYGFGSEEYAHWRSTIELGPDPFQISPEDFTKRLRGRKGRIKPLLLNQAFISGLGNIYVDESLFAAGIHPMVSAGALDEFEADSLHREVVRILSEAIDLRGSTVSNYRGLGGRGGEFQHFHKVYQRQGHDCPVCGCEISRMVVGGRGTYFCPACQPLK